MTQGKFFNLDPPKPPTRAERAEQDRQHIAFGLKHVKYVNSWERNFLLGASGFAKLSPGQRDKLGLIVGKIAASLQIEGEEEQ